MGIFKNYFFGKFALGKKLIIFLISILTTCPPYPALKFLRPDLTCLIAAAETSNPRLLNPLLDKLTVDNKNSKETHNIYREMTKTHELLITAVKSNNLINCRLILEQTLKAHKFQKSEIPEAVLDECFQVTAKNGFNLVR